jgi:type IV pilus assembly protein PilV
MHSRKSIAGFTMLEVLIAIVVIAFGLLGVAGLQVLALKNNQSASYRLIATTLANDMIDRIKTNAVGADEGAYNSTDANAYTTQVAACLTATGCTPQQLAQNDRFEWAQLLAAALPGGRGIVCLDSTPDDGINALAPECDGAPNSTHFAVKIWWNDDRNQGADPNRPLRFSWAFVP